MKLSIGPVPQTWGKEKIKDYYKEIANTDVDTVYVGEIVCRKRNQLTSSDLQEITDGLRSAGKKVYYSTLALLTKQNDFEWTKKKISTADGVEANAMGFLNLYQHNDSIVDNKDLVIGSFLNIYNWRAAKFLTKFNINRIVAPFELPGDSIEDIIKNSSAPVEVGVWGNLSISLSWRCYTSHSFDLCQDNCQKKCMDYPEGTLLKTVDDQDLFIINGLQVLAAKTHCLIEHLDKLDSMGVSSIRIEPTLNHSVEIINTFSDVINGKKNSKEAAEELTQFAPHGLCNGWFWGEEGWKYVS